MAEIYFYCSYQGGHSPKLGKVDPNKGTELTDQNLNPFLVKCFQSKNVEGACGVLPDQPTQHFILTPLMKIQGDQKRRGADAFQIQLALITNDTKRFQSWLTEDSTEQEIASKAVGAIKVKDNKHQDYGYDLNPDGVKKLMGIHYGAILRGVDPKAAGQMTCFRLAQGANVKSIGSELNLTDGAVQKGANGWSQYQSKAAAKATAKLAIMTKRKNVNQVLHGRVVA